MVSLVDPAPLSKVSCDVDGERRKTILTEFSKAHVELMDKPLGFYTDRLFVEQRNCGHLDKNKAKWARIKSQKQIFVD